MEVNVEILIFFNPELKLQGTESAIKNKLKKLLAELRGFKFVTILVSVFKQIESDDKTKYNTCYLHSKKQLLMKMTLMAYLNKSIQKGFRLDY